MAVIKVIKPGMYTSIQDLGRFNYQKSGMPVAGAMDAFSLRAANTLVGNKESEACLEITLMGPELKFEGETLIAITGGSLTPKINGKDAPMWSLIKVATGDTLSFGAIKSGCRGYISVMGGFDVPLVMGSKSTYVRGKVGGYEGRILKAGDEIKTIVVSYETPVKVVKLPEKFIPSYKNKVILRAVKGPQDDYFTEDGINTFQSSEYKVTNEADRMGYRLDGPRITHKDGADIISDGIAIGSVQVPGHGSPIIMMADRQTTGGYTKIATIITPDMDYAGQLKPGDTIQFKFITVDEAHEIYKNYIDKITAMKNYIEEFNHYITYLGFKIIKKIQWSNRSWNR